MTIKTETITLSSDGSDMDVYVARPIGAEHTPALIVFQEAFGVNSFMKDVTNRLAEQGYIAAAPELFHRTAPTGFTAGYGDYALLAEHFQAVNTDSIASDALAVHEWLINDSQVDKSHIGSIGFCLGGRASFIANAKLPIKAAVSFYGGGIAQNLLDLAPDEHAPILFFWGGLDAHITPEHRAAIMDTMTKAGKPYINVEVSDADHGFFNHEKPAYNANAARQAWALMLSFLATYLKS